MNERVPIQANLAEKKSSLSPMRPRLLQRKCACGSMPGLSGECAECQRKRLTLQRRSFNHADPSAVPPIVHDVLRSPGHPLDANTRGSMNSRFGHDFSRVRVHTDAQADESARAVNARAYTVGSDVVFGAGWYAPGTKEGQRLLAHELVHVVQQRMRNNRGKQGIADPSDYHEYEANRLSDSIVARARSGQRLTNREFAPATQGGSPTLVEEGPLGTARQNEAISNLLPPIHDSTLWIQRNGNGKGRSQSERDRSRQSRPRDAPRGTRPIDASDLDREDIHKIKDRIGAGASDWVGISPEGDVITTDEEGNAENHGPASDYLERRSQQDAESRARSTIPNWVWVLLGGAATVALIACFATGVCEIGAIIGGLSYATALLITYLLKRAGIRDSGSSADSETGSETTTASGEEASPPEEEVA
jgi:hypothetical protein